MLKKFLFIVLPLLAIDVYAQDDFLIRKNTITEAPENIDVANKRVNGLFEMPITCLFIKNSNNNEANTDYELFVDDKLCTKFKGDNTTELKCTGVGDLRNKKIEIKKSVATVLEFVFIQQPVFEIKFGLGPETLVKFDDNGNSENVFKEEAKNIFVTVREPKNSSTTYSVFVDGKPCGDFKGDATNVKVGCNPETDLRGKTITIRDKDGEFGFLTFLLKTNDDGRLKNGNASKLSPAIDEIKSKFPRLAATTYGLQVPAGNRNTAYTGAKYVHIFLDQFGNSIFSTMPQGVANRQYVVHVFYLENANDPNQVAYSVNQTSGEFQDALVFNNAGQLTGFDFRSKDENGVNITYRWANKEFLLSTSTTNIQFEVIRTALKNETNVKQEFETQTLKTYTIKMSKVYHGSFDVGLINSTLENPTFELVTSPTNPSEKVVKKNEGSNRGVVTAMATFYTSPVIMLEKLFGRRDIPDYMLSGRNFLEDHKIYERIYPAIGVGFTDKTLENLFFGFNWEFARGGAVFGGWHYGKVNVYNAPDNFEFEKIPVTTDEFDLRKNNVWKTNFAIGLNLDIMIIRNLFRPAAGSGSESN